MGPTSARAAARFYRDVQQFVSAAGQGGLAEESVHAAGFPCKDRVNAAVKQHRYAPDRYNGEVAIVEDRAIWRRTPLTVDCATAGGAARFANTRDAQVARAQSGGPGSEPGFFQVGPITYNLARLYVAIVDIITTSVLTLLPANLPGGFSMV